MLRNVAYWPIATDRILVADRRFRGITDMAGAAAGRTRTRMTHLCHWTRRFSAMHNARPQSIYCGFVLSNLRVEQSMIRALVDLTASP
jgi:hypothetical protein